MSNENTILVFCAHEQKETKHSIDIDGAGEILLTCLGNVGTDEASEACGRFLKYPKGTTAEELQGHLLTHKASNEGQISTAALEAEKAKLIDALVPKE